jgi:phosphohistidine phosphatase SixA
MLKRLALFVVVLFVASVPACAEEAKTYPARVLLIRHGEKPPAESESVALNDRGKERAEALRKLFKKTDKRPDPFPMPDFIFATKDSKKSHRPRETVTPLAKKLDLKINDSYGNDDFAKLAKELFSDPKYAGKTVLICWHHGTMPELAAKLKATGAPKHLKDTVFDRVWQIDYSSKGKTTFHDLPQRLLAGDSKK